MERAPHVTKSSHCYSCESHRLCRKKDTILKSSKPPCPREPSAITVAATTELDMRLWISAGVASNYGQCVDLWSPGTNILSASNTSDNATEYGPAPLVPLAPLPPPPS